MLHKIILDCMIPEDARPGYHWGRLFHGVLINKLPPAMQSDLHTENTRPFSQYIERRQGGLLRWHIGIWDDLTSSAIAEAILPLSEIKLFEKDREADSSTVDRNTLRVVHSQHTCLQEEEFFSQHFAVENQIRCYELRFVTPTTHKSKGEYVRFPTTEFMYRSLAQRFSEFSNRYQLDDEKSIKEMAQYTNILNYSLHSANYRLKGINIQGYMGYVVLSIKGPDPLARLAGMLLALSEYQGMGIKTALGMGGCCVLPINK